MQAEAPAGAGDHQDRVCLGPPGMRLQRPLRPLCKKTYDPSTQKKHVFLRKKMHVFFRMGHRGRPLRGVRAPPQTHPGLVTIEIASALDLPACDSNGLCDPYVKQTLRPLRNKKIATPA